MKSKNCVKLWLIISSVILIVVLFNLCVDSLGLFSSRLNTPAKLLADGKIVSLQGNVDERRFRELTINNLPKESDYIAIGSSRIMQLRQAMILDGNYSFYNYGMSGASLEDYLALLEIHFEKFGHFPKNVIFGIDPWIFNKHNGQSRYTTIEEEYKKMLNVLGLKKDKQIKSSKVEKLFSVEYVKENLRFLQNNKDDFRGYEALSNTKQNKQFYETDGSIQYAYKSRYPDPQKTMEAAKKFVSGKVYSMEEFRQFDNIELFETFIKYLQKNSTKVYFYLPPYHPFVYDYVASNPKYKIIIEVENYLAKFAYENNILLLGSYNPKKYNFTNDDFFDGMHSVDRVYEVVFAKFSE